MFSSAEVDTGLVFSVARSVLIAMVTFIPILASILSFVSCLFIMPHEGVGLTFNPRSPMH